MPPSLATVTLNLTVSERFGGAVHVNTILSLESAFEWVAPDYKKKILINIFKKGEGFGIFLDNLLLLHSHNQLI